MDKYESLGLMGRGQYKLLLNALPSELHMGDAGTLVGINCLHPSDHLTVPKRGACTPTALLTKNYFPCFKCALLKPRLANVGETRIRNRAPTVEEVREYVEHYPHKGKNIDLSNITTEYLDGESYIHGVRCTAHPANKFPAITWKLGDSRNRFKFSCTDCDKEAYIRRVKYVMELGGVTEGEAKQEVPYRYSRISPARRELLVYRKLKQQYQHLSLSELAKVVDSPLTKPCTVGIYSVKTTHNRTVGKVGIANLRLASGLSNARYSGASKVHATIETTRGEALEIEDRLLSTTGVTFGVLDLDRGELFKNISGGVTESFPLEDMPKVLEALVEYI
jgi:hypothetical protein